MQMTTAELRSLMPSAIAWAKAQQRLVLQHGACLTESQLALAQLAGVRRPGMIRILVVPAIPMPEEKALRRAATNHLFPKVIHGLTLGYGIYLQRCAAHLRPLQAHEFRHVHQYEQYPTLEAGLARFLGDVRARGANAPHEIDARKFEGEIRAAMGTTDIPAVVRPGVWFSPV